MSATEPPLAGVLVERTSGTSEAEVAAWVLAGLGARVRAALPCRTAFEVPAARGPGRRPRPDVILHDAGEQRSVDGAVAAVDAGPVPAGQAGLPDGTLTYATGLALAAGALASVRSGAALSVRSVDVALQLFLPQVMAASYRSPAWPAPPAPVPVPGGGWINRELGAPGAEDDFRRLLSTLRAGVTAEEVAAAAQEWRLPVCDYRGRPGAGDEPIVHGFDRRAGQQRKQPAGRAVAADTGGRAPLADVVVCDLTAMWAGPLATWLLGRLGAEVGKVEPACRLDGTRALDGKGIHPDGRSASPGNDSALFNALNSGKRRLDLDLTAAEDGVRLREDIARSDVVIDSFSPRVMPNLGFDRDALAGPDGNLITVSMPAFPHGPRRAWVAYGTGVHALTGLGEGPDGVFRAPAVTYPDPLAGLAATVAVLAALVGRDRGWRPCHLEVPLASAVQPLLRFPRAGRLAEAARTDTGRRLVRAAKAAEAMAPLADGAGEHLYPLGPFRGGGLPLPLAPAPRLEPALLVDDPT